MASEASREGPRERTAEENLSFPPLALASPFACYSRVTSRDYGGLARRLSCQDFQLRSVSQGTLAKSAIDQNSYIDDWQFVTFDFPRPSTCLQAMRYLAMKHERLADLKRRPSVVLQNKKWRKR